MSVAKALAARAITFLLDGLQGPTNRESREILEQALADSELRREREVREATEHRTALEAAATEHRTALEAANARAEKAEARIAEAEDDAGVSIGTAASAYGVACRRLGVQRNRLGEGVHRVCCERDELRAKVERLCAIGVYVSDDGAIVDVRDTSPTGTRIATLEADLTAARARIAELEAADALLDMSTPEHVVNAELRAIGVDPAGLADRTLDFVGKVRDEVRIATNSAVQNSKANEVEANNLRSANRTLRDRVAELEAIAREAESQANDMVAQKIAALGMAVNGAEDEEMVSPDVQVVRGDFVMTKFRERLARIDAASPPAPQGQPVATDEELCDLYVHERSLFLEDPDRTGTEARRLAIRAVAERVRRERCIIARAVAANIDVRVAEDHGGGFLVAAHRAGEDEDVERNVPAAEVPATLARLLDECA